MKRILSVMMFLCLAFSTNAYSDPFQETKILPAGQTAVTATIGKDKITALVKTYILDIGKPSDPLPQDRDSNCTYSRYPCSLVDSLQLSFNGKSVFVPRSVFSDLADLNSARFEKSGKAILLTFTGGDASEAYIMKITFNNKGVLERKLYDAEFPDAALQKTTYTLH